MIGKSQLKMNVPDQNLAALNPQTLPIRSSLGLATDRMYQRISKT